MDFKTIIAVILFGVALSMDALAVCVTQGLTYTDLNKKKSIFISSIYGLFQALFPLIGFFIIEIVQIIVTKSLGSNKGTEASIKAGNIMSEVVSWISFILLLYIGIKMLVDAIKDMKKPEEETEIKKFSYKEVLIMGIATAIDALSAGVAFHSGLSNSSTIWFHALIIMICTFSISITGIALAQKIQKLLKNNYEITGIIGGVILILLGFWVILSHYFEI